MLASGNQLNIMHHTKIEPQQPNFYEQIRKNINPVVDKGDPNCNLISKIPFIRLDAIKYCYE